MRSASPPGWRFFYTGTMNVELFLRGVLIGFSIAAPVGPIGMLAIHRTLREGRLAGLVTGLGAASADALYGAVAALGLTAVSDLLTSYEQTVRLLGGLFLVVLGARTLLIAAVERAPDDRSTSLAGAYASTLLLTLSNPATILSFTALLAGLGVGISGNEGPPAILLVLGVFLGSALWWLLLSGGVGLVRERLEGAALVWINRSAGLIIAVFGIVIMVGL